MLNNYETWRGTAAELGETAGRLLRQINVDDQELSERLVRYYVQSGVLDRPVREGREAFFRYRQLLQLLFARMMAADGWPLSKIANYCQAATLKALLDLIPHPVPGAEKAPGQSPIPQAEGPIGSDAAMFAQLASAGALVKVFGKNAAGVPTRQWVELTLSRYCRVLLDQQSVNTLNPELIETLVNTFAQTLQRLSD